MCLASMDEVLEQAAAPTDVATAQQDFDAALKVAQCGVPELARGFPEPPAKDAASVGKVAPRAAQAGGAQGGAKAAETAKETHALDKTKLCKFFLKGQCRRGQACSFAHGRRQLRPQPNLYRTQMCIDFIGSGVCTFGAACKYAHSESEMRAMEPAKKAKGAAAPRTAPQVAGAVGHAANEGSGADSVARELELVQMRARQLEARLQTLQKTDAAGTARSSPAEPRAQCGARSLDGQRPRRAERATSEEASALSPSSCAAGAMRASSGAGSTAAESEASEGEREVANSWTDSVSDSAACADAEQVVEVCVTIRNTFFEVVPVSPAGGAARRALSAHR